MLKNSHGQAYQESFVMSMLDYKKNGFYVEIGGYDSQSLSNTYVLESEYNWRGFSLEIDKAKANKYAAERINTCIAANAITFDYAKAFKEFDAPKQIDYLQLDIEPAPNTLACLYKIPMNYRYSVITFEHDLYADPQKHSVVKNSAREYLQGFGYKLVVSNVYAFKNNPSPFEDWYVDPLVIDKSVYSQFISENIRPQILFS